MKRSSDRILTTHAGSLPRPADLLDMIKAKTDGKPVDQATFERTVTRAVADCVKQQAAAGIDVVCDGEMGKPSFVTYANDRLSGYEVVPGERPSVWAKSREVASFPKFYEQLAAGTQAGQVRTRRARYVCTGPLAYRGQKQLQTDLDNLKAALKGVNAAEAFVPAISPTNLEFAQPNQYYKTEDEYLIAIADAMHVEYKAIVDAGFLLQIDDPHLVTNYITRPDLTVAECRKWAEKRVEALNHALKGIPEDRVRFHTCYSINIGPRVHDMQLKDIVDVMMKIRAQAFSFEAANPRHDHEWKVWANVKLNGKVLIPGVITQSTVLVEHPELVADRLLRYASVVGRENVIAGADCGFASFAAAEEIESAVVWAKLEALVEGARIASAQLWGRAAA